jgi:hypothetical protein
MLLSDIVAIIEQLDIQIFSLFKVRLLSLSAAAFVSQY